MIQNYRDLYAGKVIAVIGSGPTAIKYSGKEDIAIVLNGAINLAAKTDYFMGFDLSIPELSYYYSNTAITRLVGANIVSMDRIVYPDLLDRQRKILRGGHVTENEFHLSNIVPKSPHGYWFFQTRKSPIFDKGMMYLSAMGNISVPGVETAIIMGAKRINLYGIDLGKRGYFYAPSNSKQIKAYQPQRSKFMNDLLTLCLQNGIEIGVCRGQTSRVTVGENIG